MPEPKDVRIDGLLSNVSIAFRNPSFVADTIAPPIEVGAQKAKYPVYGKERFAIARTLRAPKTAAAEVGWTVTWKDYTCDEHSLQEAIDDQERRAAVSSIDVERDTTEFVTDMILLAHEKRVADLVTDPAVITQHVDLAAGTCWSDPANSDPVKNVLDGAAVIRAATGVKPNTMLMSESTFAALKVHHDILDRVKYSALGVVTLDLLKALFEIPNIALGQTVYNTAAEGHDAVLADVWGDTVVLGYVDATPTLKRPRLAATPFWVDRGLRRITDTWRDENRSSNIIRVKEHTDEVVMCAEAGYLIVNTIA